MSLFDPQNASQSLLYTVTFTQVRPEGAQLKVTPSRQANSQFCKCLVLKRFAWKWRKETTERESLHPSKAGSSGKMESLLLEAWLCYLKYLRFSLSYICKKTNWSVHYFFYPSHKLFTGPLVPARHQGDPNTQGIVYYLQGECSLWGNA